MSFWARAGAAVAVAVVVAAFTWFFAGLGPEVSMPLEELHGQLEAEHDYPGPMTPEQARFGGMARLVAGFVVGAMTVSLMRQSWRDEPRPNRGMAWVAIGGFALAITMVGAGIAAVQNAASVEPTRDAVVYPTPSESVATWLFLGLPPLVALGMATAALRATLASGFMERALVPFAVLLAALAREVPKMVLGLVVAWAVFFIVHAWRLQRFLDEPDP